MDRLGERPALSILEPDGLNRAASYGVKDDEAGIFNRDEFAHSAEGKRGKEQETLSQYASNGARAATETSAYKRVARDFFRGLHMPQKDALRPVDKPWISSA